MKQLGLAAVVLVSASLLACPAALGQTAHTPPADRAGVDLGIRIGYAIPFGDIGGNHGALAGWVPGAVPVVLEAGYRFNRRFTVGPYFQFAFAQVKESSDTGCGSNSDCTGWIVRAGVQGLFHPDVKSFIAPWVGLGTGYEWTNYSGSVNGGPLGSVGFSASAGGWELVNVQLGGDVLVEPGMKLGPFASFSVARYTSESGRLGNLGGSSDVSGAAVHEWLQFGARLTFGL